MEVEIKTVSRIASSEGMHREAVREEDVGTLCGAMAIGLGEFIGICGFMAMDWAVECPGRRRWGWVDPHRSGVEERGG